MKDNIILDKSFSFAVRIVKLYKYLCDEKKEYVLSKQLLRCGTSIGANINEAQAGQSKADFIAKMSIASKEARDAGALQLNPAVQRGPSKYWIDLLIKTEYLNINDQHTRSLLNDIEEIVKLLTSIVKSLQGK